MSMERRTFLKGSIAASMVAGLGPLASTASAQASRMISTSQFFELRRYRVGKKGDAEAVKEFYREAAIPALNRIGIDPVGVFEKMEPGDDPVVYALFPFQSLDQMVQIPIKLGDDDRFMDAAEDYLGRPESSPAFDRIESSLMAAFEGMPRLEVPKAKKQGEDRIFELRTYESYSEFKGWKKVQMFNDGEIEIFRETGLTPVFFGKTMIGDQLPNLTYMITFADREERDRNWDKFLNHPDWKKLSKDPQYEHTVSAITNHFLVPTSFSQV